MRGLKLLKVYDNYTDIYTNIPKCMLIGDSVVEFVNNKVFDFYILQWTVMNSVFYFVGVDGYKAKKSYVLIVSNEFCVLFKVRLGYSTMVGSVSKDFLIIKDRGRYAKKSGEIYADIKETVNKCERIRRIRK